MDELQDNSIDVIITSPPYNRGKQYISDTQEEYNDSLSEQDYLTFLTNVWKECYRVANQKAVFFLNIGDSATDQGKSEKVAQCAESVGWIRIQDIVWIKSIYGRGHYTPTGNNKRFNNLWEHIFMFVKNPKEYSINPKAIGIPYVDKSNIGRYSSIDLRDAGNVFHIPYEKTTGASIKKRHDAPFPIGLPYDCIKVVENCTTVLDPFVGTGTTLAAAYLLGKKGFGYELYPLTTLIQDTIQNASFESNCPILIPHYETTIQTLVSLLKTFEFDTSQPLSKKQKEQYQIVIDTLMKLKIQSPFLDQLKRCEKQNE